MLSHINDGGLAPLIPKSCIGWKLVVGFTVGPLNCR